LPGPSLDKELRRLLRELPERFHAETFILNVNVTVNIMPNFVNISGGSVGALNLSGLQIVESIDMKIGDLRKDTSAADFADALKALTEAIGSPTNPLSEQQRILALKQLNALGKEATTPAGERNEGVVHALVNTLANVCAGAGGLATVWATWGPAISKFFGI
jgi:hypothetical protein